MLLRSAIILFCLVFTGCSNDNDKILLNYSQIGPEHLVVYSDSAFQPPLKFRLYDEAKSKLPITEFDLHKPWFQSGNERADSALELINLPGNWQRIEIEKTGWLDKRQYLVPIENEISKPASNNSLWSWIIRNKLITSALLIFAAYMIIAGSTGALFVTQGATSVCMFFLIVFIVMANHWQFLNFAAYILCLAVIIVTITIYSMLPMPIYILNIIVFVAAMLLMHIYKDYESQASYVTANIIQAYLPADLRHGVALRDEQDIEIASIDLQEDTRIIMFMDGEHMVSNFAIIDEKDKTETIKIENK